MPTSITGLSPNFGPTTGGNVIEIDGSGFTGTSAVSFGNSAVFAYMAMSDNVLYANVPWHAAGVVDVTVTSASGTSALVGADQYTYMASAPTATNTYLSSSADPSSLGQNVTFTAMVSSSGAGTPTGTVTFKDGATVLGTGTLSSGMMGTVATLTTSTLIAGSHNITAVYGGDSSFAGSTSLALSQVVNGPATWVVTNIGDMGMGSQMMHTGDLRFCLGNAGDGDVIDFNLPGGGVQTITLLSALPSIHHSITLDGYSEPGGSGYAPMIQLDGNHLTANGLDIEAGGVTIQGLAIYNFGLNGVLLNNPAGSAGDVLKGCYIGTNVAGDSGVGNGTGVLVEGPNDIVGDATGVANTIVSGNQQDGIDVSGANATGALITFDWVGVGLSGLVALANGGNGVRLVHLTGDGTCSHDVVSGNLACGVFVEGSANVLYDDKIGVGKDGKTPVANGTSGVLLNDASDNFLGLAGQGKNIISGNGGAGVNINGGSQNQVVNNWIGIGTGASGAAVEVGNQYGVILQANTWGNTIGGQTDATRNVISASSRYGVYITDGATGNFVQGNYIGTDDTGAKPMGNHLTGVLISSTCTNNTIGGTATGAKNVISANASAAPTKNFGYGVLITGNSNRVQGNIIGLTSAKGDPDFPLLNPIVPHYLYNDYGGIYIDPLSSGNTNKDNTGQA